MALKHPFCQCDDPGPGPGPGPDPGPIELDGDVTGPSTATVVEAIQSVPVEAGTPSDKDVLTFDAGDGKAKWAAPGSSGVESVATLDELRAIPSAGLGAELRFVEETGILWRYDAATGADEIDDGAVSVKPDDKAQADAGRWRPVTLPGLPAWEPMPGATIPTAHVGASLIAMGAKPIVTGQPGDAPMFTGFLVDMGDEAGVKRPYALVALSSDGIEVMSLNMATMQTEDSVSLRQGGVRFAPGGRHEIIVGSGGSGHGASDVSLDIAAGNRGAGDADGTLTLRGGGSGATMVLEGGTSGGNATIAAQGDATVTAHGGAIVSADGDAIVSAYGVAKLSGNYAMLEGAAIQILAQGVPVMQAEPAGSQPRVGFFGSLGTTRPIITGSRSDGSAWESLLDALVALGLVEDQTTP